MMPIVLELEYPGLGYKEGSGGARWKSPLLPYKQAEEQLDIHLLYNHPLGRIGGKHGGAGGAVAPPGVGVTCKLGMALRKIRNWF